jgi:glucose uptake protein GlcU
VASRQTFVSQSVEKTHLAFSGEQYEIIKTVLGVKFFQKRGNNQEILGIGTGIVCSKLEKVMV